MSCARASEIHFVAPMAPGRSTPGAGLDRYFCRLYLMILVGDDRSVKIKSLEAAKIMKIKWLVLGCIDADFCK